MSDNQLQDFIEKLRRIEGEIQLLNEEKKELFADYKEQFDPKVLREAVRSVKARLKLGDSVIQLDQIVAELEKTYTF
jgi:uncharacterized protein (UPF0335 family)